MEKRVSVHPHKPHVLGICRIIVSFARLYALEVGLVSLSLGLHWWGSVVRSALVGCLSLCLHCFLRLSHALYFHLRQCLA